VELTGFDTIVCLCVDGRYAAEWPRVRDLIRAKGAQAECFVDGKGALLPPGRYDQISPDPPDGWRGFPASYCHFRAFQAIVRGALGSGAEALLFVEDDVAFTPEFDGVVRAAARQARENAVAWDLLYYGANHTWARTRQVAPNLLRVFGSYATHCLAVRRAAFEPILALPPVLPMDMALAAELHPTHGCYSVWPSVAVQKPGFSFVNGTYEDYSGYFRSKGRPVDDG